MSCVQFNWAQDIHLSYHQLSEQDGLTQSDHYFISTDVKGFAWIGSDNGLLRYDGHTVLKYQHRPNDTLSLAENKITSRCFEDEESNLWFSSFGAINCYNRQSDNFSRYTIEKDLKDYHAFHFDGKKLWLRIGAGQLGHLYFFDIATKKFKESVSLIGAECNVVKNENGEIVQLISTALPDQPGLQCIDLQSGKVTNADFLYSNQGYESPFPSPTRGGLIDRDGDIWVGLYDGLGKYKLGDTLGLILTDEFDDMGWVHNIAEYDERRLLIAADKGLLIFDKQNELFSRSFQFAGTDKYALRLKGINDLVIDDAGNLWLSGTDQEIAFANLNKNRFSHINKTLGITITNISEDSDGNIWCSSLDSGTYVFTPQKELLWHTKLLSNPAFEGGYNPLPEIYFFLKDDLENWWGNIGNYFFLWDKQLKGFKIDFAYFLGVANTKFDRVNYCYALSDGKNLIARGASIYELKLSEAQVDTLPWFALDSFGLNVINIIYQDRNKNIFIGDDYGRLLIVNIKNDQLNVISNIADFGIINAFQEDVKRNKLWVSGANGLGSFETSSMVFMAYEDNSDFLAKEVLNEIILDKGGDLWLPGNNGVFRVNPDARSSHRFTTADGLLSSVFNKNASIISSKTGEIWIGGKNGINVFKPDDIQLLANKPTAQITNLLVNDESFAIDGNLNEIKNLELHYSQNTLSFQFAALDYAEPTANQFYYQMEGLDKERVANDSRGFTRYGNIPPGKYRFKVWATNSDLVLNEQPLELNIRIIPPFYQRWWFYLLMLMLISAIIYAIFQYRLEQALKVERLRTRIASDLHDDVGGILSGLAMQSEILELTAKEEEEKGKLRQLAEMSRSAMSGMRDTVWAIDARLDKFEDMLDRMREHAEETLTPKDLHFNFEVTDIDVTQIISANIRQNLYLIYKEAITNAAKHSNGDRVEISLKNTPSHFEMRIHDNGNFEKKEYKTTGMGQSNMKMRAEKLGAELETKVGEGYEVLVRMKKIG